MSRGTINRLENERPASIDFKVLESLADALQVDPSYLIVREKRKRG